MCRACIANAMVILYVARIREKNTDISYNAAWMGLWALAEISFGIIVTCTFSLPKFIEAEGTRIRGVLSSLTRPFASLKSVGSFSKKDTAASLDMTLDRVSGSGHSESNISFAANRDQDIERHLSEKGGHTIAKYPRVDTTDLLHGVRVV